MSFCGKIAAYSDNHMKLVDEACEQNAELVALTVAPVLQSGP
jgi:hypothetical protein